MNSMHVTMVKKRLLNGEPCKKCVDAEKLLENRGLMSRIDEVVWAVEGEPQSAGMKLAKEHQVDLAPFFVVRDDGGTTRIYTSTLQFIKEALGGSPVNAGVSTSAAPLSADEVATIALEFDKAPPERTIRWLLERFGREAAIAFSGAEDVAVLDIAVKTGLPFSVFTLDTGRLHPETYRFIEKVRTHYGVSIELMSPQAEPLQAFVEKKGLFSFYNDGHGECCGIRKLEPMRRALAKQRAWITGQRRDQSPTRTDVAVLQIDSNLGLGGQPLVKLNPLAAWSLQKVWSYIRANEVPYNELHDQGFISIGCEPCTRVPRPGEHERAGRWWWEEATKRECGLHV
ncbi:MAG TPA: phosphoadenylyl-sulfate reductase [Polyangiaceae bacterium]|nr:phosphoadenylyl-sulfate reductase [Polyangiaceae bacterium]